MGLRGTSFLVDARARTRRAVDNPRPFASARRLGASAWRGRLLVPSSKQLVEKSHVQGCLAGLPPKHRGGRRFGQAAHCTRQRRLNVPPGCTQWIWGQNPTLRARGAGANPPEMQGISRDPTRCLLGPIPLENLTGLSTKTRARQ